MSIPQANMSRVVRSNRHYARSVKWIDRFDQIVQVLGFKNMSPGEHAFAQAITEWQKKNPPLVADGMLGPKTWAKLEPLTRFTVNIGTELPTWLSALSSTTSHELHTATSSTETVYILAAIDGTDSREWRNKTGSNSHVYKFYRDFQVNGGKKAYFHGPNLSGTLSPNIIHLVTEFIMDNIITYSDAEVCLVGHSRGGLIAIAVAKRLKGYKKVHFLGLYDAVDRAMDVDSEVISNVKYVYHARRHSSVSSRPYFGNTGTKYETDVLYHEDFFYATHGGVGGDPQGGSNEPFYPSSELGPDGKVQWLIPRPPLGFNVEIEKPASRLADSYIREGAQKADLSFKNN